MSAASVATQISAIDKPLHGMRLEERALPTSRNSDAERDQRADRRLNDAQSLKRGDRSVAFHRLILTITKKISIDAISSESISALNDVMTGPSLRQERSPR
jgi:hypothetical protein